MPEQLDLFAPSSSPRRGGVVIGAGPRAVEGLLLDALAGRAAETRRDGALLARPVRVVVPSRSLRQHVAAAVAARLGGAAGIAVQTLHGLACEVVERAGEPLPVGDQLFDVVVARLARREASLRAHLEPLVEGYRHVAASVRDLLDAGLEATHAEAILELLAERGGQAGSRGQVARAAAVVRVARDTEAALARLGAARTADVLRRAAALLGADPGRLPARAIYVHGFADATALAGDLLEALLRDGATLFVDWPRRPGAAGQAEEPEHGFTGRLLARLGAFPTTPVSGQAGPVRLDRFSAAGPDGEAREIALRAREHIAQGTAPEAIGVVGRDLEGHRLALRRHFRKLGVAFSGGDTRGPVTPAGRLARALLELLRLREALPADRFLELVGRLPAGPRVDLRLAFMTLGTARLGDVATLVPDNYSRGLPLPVRLGLAPVEGTTSDAIAADSERTAEQESEARAGFAQPRKVAADRLAAVIATAAAVCRRLADWPERGRLDAHLVRLDALLDADLEWPAHAPPRVKLAEGAAQLAAAIAPRVEIGLDELELLLERAYDEVTASPLGGEGGGVQLLTATEARGRCFRQLFVIGLNREVLPRAVHEDALLPDSLRALLLQLLPELPLKRGVFEEDRYLFAQLLGAAPDVTCSWQRADADGKLLAPSPLLERLGVVAGAPGAAPLLQPPAGTLLPADEAATVAALATGRRGLRVHLTQALAEARSGLVTVPGSPSASVLASARLRILAEVEPDRGSPLGRQVDEQLGPYFGFVGPREGAPTGEPRLRPLFVTALEGLSRCPWRLFLTRLLRFERTPDPLATLPGLDTLLLGDLVHQVLDAIVQGGRDGDAVRWPAASELAGLLRERAAALLAEQGRLLPGLVQALAERAMPYLEAARASDWILGGKLPRPVASEATEQIELTDLAGRHRQLHFIADRRDGEGKETRWTDYKVGRPPTDYKTSEKRRADLLAKVRAGTLLQGAAYALAGGPQAVGRYLFLRPDLEPEQREYRIEGDDRELLAAFEASVRAGMAAWDEGSFFPRLTDEGLRKELPLCRYCEVAEACLRGDSGARRRLTGWVERAQNQGLPAAAGSSEAALLGMWPDDEKPAAGPRRGTRR